MGLLLETLAIFCTLLLSSTQCEEMCTSAGDVVFVVDSSGSIRDQNPSDGSYDNWNIILEFVVKVVERLNVSADGSRVGFVTFSSEANNTFFLNDYFTSSSVIERVRNVTYIGATTNTSGGIRLMTHQQFVSSKGDRGDVPNFGVVITDGESNEDEFRLRSDAEEAERLGIKVFAIGITNAINTEELANISSSPHKVNETWWTNPDFITINQLLPQIANAICARDLPPINAGSLTSFGFGTYFLSFFLAVAGSSLLKT